MRFFFLLLLLVSCARTPPVVVGVQRPDRVAVFSRIGNSFVVNLQSKALLRPKETVLDIASWNLDQNFAEQFREGLRERGREFVDFALDRGELERVLKVRESRWKKIEGKESQALLDFLLRSAEANGIRWIFLLSPELERARFPLHQGEVGAYCNDKAKADSKAYIYFFFRFSVWDVERKKKIFEQLVDPSVSEAIGIGGFTHEVLAGVGGSATSSHGTAPAKRERGLTPSPARA